MGLKKKETKRQLLSKAVNLRLSEEEAAQLDIMVEDEREVLRKKGTLTDKEIERSITAATITRSLLGKEYNKRYKPRANG